MRFCSGCSIASPFTTAGKNIPALVSHEALNAVKSKFKEEEYEAADKKEAQADWLIFLLKSEKTLFFALLIYFCAVFTFLHPRGKKRLTMFTSNKVSVG